MLAQPGERHGDQPVGRPLAGRGQAERGRPDAVGEHLAEQHPDHRAPRHAERDHEQVGGDQRDRARTRRAGSACRRPASALAKMTAIVTSVTAMPDEPISSSGLRPILSISAIAISVVSDVDHRRDHGDRSHDWLCVEADRLPQHVGVVEDHVDADELLEDRQPEADPDDAVEAAGRLAQVAPGRLVLALQRLLDPVDGDLEVLLAEQHGQHPAGFRNLVAGNEIARRLRNGEGQHAVQDRGHRHHQEHPAPGLQPEPQRLARAAGELRQQVVDRERQEDAGHDRQLLQRAEPAADARRRRLGDVGRRDDRGHADADAADDPEQHRPVQTLVRQAGADRADRRTARAAIFITEMRPIWSAIRPAVIAPTAAPSSADATAKPSFGVADAEVVLDRVAPRR